MYRVRHVMYVPKRLWSGYVPKRLCPEVCPETVMSRSGYVPKRLCPEVAMSRNACYVPKLCPGCPRNGYVPKRPAPHYTIQLQQRSVFISLTTGEYPWTVKCPAQNAWEHPDSQWPRISPVHPLLTHSHRNELGYLDCYSAQARGSGWACV